MDQVKVFLRQCVKYRFWIAFGISLLVPVIGYFVGAGTIVAATTAAEGAITQAKTGVQPFQSGSPPIPAYKQLVDEKKAVLTTDVDATWRKLYNIQEPLLRWPAVVEDKFRTWGRKWPVGTDPAVVQDAIIDYTIAYRDFVTRVYATCNPWNPEDGKGVVFVPDMDSLLTPAPFSQDAPPLLGKVWAEQERLWVATALLDVVAKANNSVKATDWDGAIIKQILALEVGTPTAEDQKSLAKGLALEPSPVLNPDGTSAAPAAAAGAPEAGGMGGMIAPGMSMGAGAGKSSDVFSIKPEGTPPYKILPIRITVLVDQSHLPDFLVGLENSPMAIQVLEPEISRPSVPVTKPIYGETNFAAGGMGMGMGMGGGMMNKPGMGMGNSLNMNMSMGNRGGPMPGRPGGELNMGPGGMMPGGGMMGPGGGAAAAKKGTDQRGTNKAQERIEKAKAEAAKKKNAGAVKKVVDPYYNIIEVTVYGQARFYNTPPAPPVVEPSTAAPAPADAPKAEAAPAPAGGVPAPAPAEAPKPGEPAPAPADAPKAEAPKPVEPAPADAPKPDAPKAETPKP